MRFTSGYSYLPVMVYLLLLATAPIGCKQEMTDKERMELIHGELKEVVPVSGTVKINGVAEKGVLVTLFDETGAKMAKLSPAITDAEGAFAFTTYMSEDGVEPGRYKVTFKWVEFVKDKKMGMQMSGKDKLNNAYSDPKKSSFILTVEPDSPQDTLLYELTK